jgi:hypothetical protein
MTRLALLVTIANTMVVLVYVRPVRAQDSEVKPCVAAECATQRNKTLANPLREPDEAARMLIQQVSVSGRILVIVETPSERLTPPRELAPGVAPLLSFRSFDREARYRLGRLDLVVDDAGH